MREFLQLSPTRLPVTFAGLSARNWTVSVVGDALGFFTDAPEPPPKGEYIWRGQVVRVRRDGSTIVGPQLAASTPWVGVRDFHDGRYLLMPHEQQPYVVDFTGLIVEYPPFQRGYRDVCITASGGVWIGYDDEGDRLGGLSFFDHDHIEQFYHEPRGVDGTSFWCCYALNGSDTEAWCYYYTEFDIVRVLVDGTEQRWTVNFPGARAIAVSGDIVALLSGYGSLASQCCLFRLCEDGSSQELCRHNIELAEGRLIDWRTSVFGRQDALHLFSRNEWYRTTIKQLLDARGNADSNMFPI